MKNEQIVGTEEWFVKHDPHAADHGPSGPAFFAALIIVVAIALGMYALAKLVFAGMPE